ncbi:GIY-YIG nuclease family protein [Gelatiniphilus marinus]|uniref:GIY-YIG nuclease family protein n=1 Tax=Gelatiniphilus marinus TaxID=1759464 RepID=A0ABW5JXD6_9FLAO
MNFVYILYSKLLDKFYVGEASNLEERIEQHNYGFYNNAFTNRFQIGCYIIISNVNLGFKPEK